MSHTNDHIDALKDLCRSIQNLLCQFGGKQSPFEGLQFMARLAWSYRDLLKHHFYCLLSNQAQKKIIQSFLHDIKTITLTCISKKAPHTKLHDHRFKSELWHQSSYYYFHAACFLSLEKHLSQSMEHSTLKDRDLHQLRFCAELITSALNPSNFLHSNPVAIKHCLESKGVTAIKGLSYYFNDICQWQGHLGLSKVDSTLFIKGKTIATSKGKVIFKNHLLELIFYEPITEKSDQRPLLWITSWVNKFYIIDLKPKNSLVQYALSQGFPVFAISWVNASIKNKNDGIEQYLLEGLLPALEIIRHYFPHQPIHAAGYCLGGTLLMIAASYFEKNKQQWFASLSFIASIADFHSHNSMASLMGPEQRLVFKHFLNKNHLWDGYKMQVGFNLTHSDEYIWPFAQRRYLYGKPHLSLDSIYWALDLTHTSEALYWFYIKSLHGDNQLMQANSLTIANTNIDIKNITTPCCLVSFHDDKLSPPSNVCQLEQSFSSSCTIIEASGTHVGGLLTPPNKETEKKEITTKSHHSRGQSWWPAWVNFLRKNRHTRIVDLHEMYINTPSLQEAPGNYIND